MTTEPLPAALEVLADHLSRLDSDEIERVIRRAIENCPQDPWAMRTAIEDGARERFEQ